MHEGARAQRVAILEALNVAGPCTYEELDRLMAWPAATSARRLTELRRAGCVDGVGTRATGSGRQATVYRITQTGVAELSR